MKFQVIKKLDFAKKATRGKKVFGAIIKAATTKGTIRIYKEAFEKLNLNTGDRIIIQAANTDTNEKMQLYIATSNIENLGLKVSSPNKSGLYLNASGVDIWSTMRSPEFADRVVLDGEYISYDLGTEVVEHEGMKFYNLIPKEIGKSKSNKKNEINNAASTLGTEENPNKPTFNHNSEMPEELEDEELEDEELEDEELEDEELEDEELEELEELEDEEL